MKRVFKERKCELKRGTEKYIPANSYTFIPAENEVSFGHRSKLFTFDIFKTTYKEKNKIKLQIFLYENHYKKMRLREDQRFGVFRRRRDERATERNSREYIRNHWSCSLICPRRLLLRRKELASRWRAL